MNITYHYSMRRLPMKHVCAKLFTSLTLSIFLLTGCTADSLVSGEAGDQEIVVSVSENNGNGNANGNACWGQAAAVFAQLGEMGEHSSSFSGEPREGLANLARELYDDGALSDDTLQALGAFVAAAYGLSISACM